MCYYDMIRWHCGYWKWSTFRGQCPREHRTGETCGLKLVMDTLGEPDVCKICEQVYKKRRRQTKLMQDVARWQKEGNRRATIEKTQQDIQDIECSIEELEQSHRSKTGGPGVFSPY